MKEFKIYVPNSKENHFFPLIFLNVDSLLDIKDRVLKFSFVVLGIIMKGTVSQIFFYLGPSFCFM